ncbi:alpha/beta hydrolase [Spirosoma endophyticum]|uniref:Acetyl esterase/lipase n=1 Tax=Spirosoma endophyticum TaxID=662367 RepID=A0A1I2DVH2_9BACT|nr:alpha/beta hydrolase [Spirosoma endophyticum]SFE84536.1 Acetyl esterase/lipase [Spirosoma endophyticum]
MKRFLMISSLAVLSQLVYISATAQSVADSSRQKIAGERTYYETLGKIYPADASVPVAETSLAGVKSYWFNKPLLNQKHIVIYLHGGMYALGSINSYWAMVSHLAKRLNLPIVYVEYSLSPEHPYPAAVNENLAVYRALQKAYPGYKFSIIGDSAGGGLAVQLVNSSVEAKLPVPASLALISPWVDLKTRNESYASKQAADPILSRKMLHDHALLYNPATNKAADPSELTFKTFPPVLVLVGTDEVLNDDAKNFYQVIKLIQPRAKLKEFEGQKHVWPVSSIDSKASVEALRDIDAFVKAN